MLRPYSCQLSGNRQKVRIFTITDYRLPITDYLLPITYYLISKYASL
ncbi:MAG: hypothetical protein HEQ33_15135 [Dolichospermum sp. WA123]|nr:hypothetical protein [Dolichospermum sp. WA123]